MCTYLYILGAKVFQTIKDLFCDFLKIKSENELLACKVYVILIFFQHFNHLVQPWWQVKEVKQVNRLFARANHLWPTIHSSGRDKVILGVTVHPTTTSTLEQTPIHHLKPYKLLTSKQSSPYTDFLYQEPSL